MADQASLYTATRAITLDVLAVHGASEPDRLSKFGVTHELLDGSLAEQIVGGRREISIDFKTMTILQRRQVVDWWLDPDRELRSLAGTPGTFVAASNTGGSLTAALHTYTVCAIDVIGNSIAATTDADTTSGADLQMDLSWAAVTGARCYKIFRKIAAGNWFVLDYTTGTTYTDDGSVTAYKDMGTDDPPVATSHIHVISTNELEFRWDGESEIGRFLSLELREASIFTSAAKFPV